MIKKKASGFLFRGQPIHLGHLFMIKKALKESDIVLCVLGSANKEGTTRNPFSLEKRKKWLMDSLILDDEISLEDTEKIRFLSLPDWSTETDTSELNQWGHYLYYNMVRAVEQKEISIYYNDDKSIIEAWFDDEISKNITIEHSERSEIFEGLSATKLRKAIVDNDIEYCTKFLPKPVLADLDEIRPYLIEINENPKQDFSME